MIWLCQFSFICLTGGLQRIIIVFFIYFSLYLDYFHLCSSPCGQLVYDSCHIHSTIDAQCPVYSRVGNPKYGALAFSSIIFLSKLFRAYSIVLSKWYWTFCGYPQLKFIFSRIRIHKLLHIAWDTAITTSTNVIVSLKLCMYYGFCMSADYSCDPWRNVW